MSILSEMMSRAVALKRTIVLPEGDDPRVVAAAVQAQQDGLCQIVLLGSEAEIAASAAAAGCSIAGSGVEVVDPATSEWREELAGALYERRKKRGMSAEQALDIVSTNRLYFGCMMVSCNRAHGVVAGAVASTGDMLRSAFHCVGTAPGIRLASSSFIMDLATPSPAGDEVLLFADCAVNPNPTAEELVDIAQSTAATYRQLIGGEPRVAFLSFSTKGSARHEMVEKVERAVELTRERFAEQGLGVVVDGELQADAALVPAVGAVKNSGGAVQGNANVLIFPDLQSGNIGYKLVERLAGATAIGPLVQGLARPVNDLSRGCSVADIMGTICMTVLQGEE